MTVLVGRVAPLGPQGVPSGFVKHSVDGPVMATAAGLAGDEQADRRVHGAPDKAVYGYDINAYDYWRRALPCHAERFGPGAMGENLAITGLNEADVAIGDRVRVGTALLQVTQPRQPCFKLALAFDDPAMLRALIRSGRCGWYYRTLEPGTIAAGDAVLTVERPNPGWPISRFFDMTTVRAPSRDALTEIAALTGVADSWRLKALRALGRGRDGG